MKRLMHGGLLVVGTVMAVAACSDAVDIEVANPCSEAVSVRVWVFEGFTSEDRLTEVEPEAEGTVPAGKVVEVGSAISAPGDYEYVLLAGTAVVRFDEQTLKDNNGVLVLRAADCAEMLARS